MLSFPLLSNPLVTGALHLAAPIGGDLTLSLREEYAFDRQRLIVNRYSYNLIDATGINVLRARTICLFTVPTTASVL